MEFTITAMRRAKLLDVTLASFKRNLITSFDTLYLNIDPAGPDASHNEAIEVACKYFKRVFPFTPEECSFSGAIKRLWDMPQDKYFFHMEDDWILEKRVKVEDLEAILQAAPDALGVNLRHYPTRSDAIFIAACLFRSEWAKNAAMSMQIGLNPEQQLRDGQGFLRCIGYPLGTSDTIMKDIGRKWLRGTKWNKDMTKPWDKWTNTELKGK